MTIVRLARPDRVRIEAEARAALPRECCGLLEGRRDGAEIHVLGICATQNISDAADRFAIDPADHIRLLRAARARGNAIVGCYHSHPGAPAHPSAHDQAGASEDGFLWLIAGIAADAVALRAYVFSGGAFAEATVAEAG